MAKTIRPTGNNLCARTRRATIERLNRQLADVVDLQSRQAHWIMEGPHLISLDDLFDRLADELFETVAEELEERNDRIAERA